MNFTINSIVFLLFVTFTTKAQDLPVNTSTGKITYLEVVDATGLSPKDIYATAKKWGESKGFTVKEDKENESLVFEGSTLVEYPNAAGNGQEKGNVKFSFSVFVKDGKFRFIATDLVHEGLGKSPVSGGKLENVSPECGKTKMSGKGWVTIKNKADANMKALTNDLKRVMKETQNDPAKKTDW